VNGNIPTSNQQSTNSALKVVSYMIYLSVVCVLSCSSLLLPPLVWSLVSLSVGGKGEGLSFFHDIDIIGYIRNA
jgi:hypothetical protein